MLSAIGKNSRSFVSIGVTRERDVSQESEYALVHKHNLYRAVHTSLLTAGSGSSNTNRFSQRDRLDVLKSLSRTESPECTHETRSDIA